MDLVMPNVTYFKDLAQIPQIPPAERATLEVVSERFQFRANDYYLSLIDWNDPDDPIRRIVVPVPGELSHWGRLDPSTEADFTVVAGLQHKYEFTALLLVNDMCGGFCRFCFRKRLFIEEAREVSFDVTEAVAYIRQHPEISNVLLTGGDALFMPTERLARIIRQLHGIDHLKVTRIGSKLPAFDPFRILNDPELIDMFATYSTPGHKIYLMTHFNHPRELTEPALKALDLVQRAGVTTANQTPLIRGVNDTPETLGDLFNRLSAAGVAPYYVFQCRPTEGNLPYAVPVEEGFEIFEQGRMACSGIAKRARYVMSHSTGKVEVVGLTKREIFIRYHRSADPETKARFMVFERDPGAYWFDDYREVQEDYSIENPFRCYGPE